MYDDNRSAEGSPAEPVPRLPLAAATSPVEVLYIGRLSVLPTGAVLAVIPAAAAAAWEGDCPWTGKALLLLAPEAAMVNVEFALKPAAAAA